jgi:hypothetical protein
MEQLLMVGSLLTVACIDESNGQYDEATRRTIMYDEANIHGCPKCDCKEPGYRDNAIPQQAKPKWKFKMPSPQYFRSLSKYTVLVGGGICFIGWHNVLISTILNEDEQKLWHDEYMRAMNTKCGESNCTDREATYYADRLIAHKRMADIRMKERTGAPNREAKP